ncbi:hypothetical protein DIPPA_11181 [Diplonema papillatum]|nr:hypothetical protein DIPPA_11181 [Diplonema papillatum]
MLAVALPALLSLAAGWVNMFPGADAPGSPLAMMEGISCVSSTECFVAGGGIGAKLAFKLSGADLQTVEPLNVKAEVVVRILDAIAMRNATHGLVAAIDAGTPGGFFSTHDGYNFSVSGLTAEVGSGQLYTTSFGYAYVGQQYQKSGFATWTDSAAGFSTKFWPPAVAPNAPARYGSFPSAEVWYATAGAWWRNIGPGQPAYGYVGYVLKTSDGGETFSAVFNTTGKYYLNGIACASETLCVSAGRATSEEGSQFPGVHVVRTADGGSTWNETYTFGATTGGNVFDVQFASETEVWVGATNENGAVFLHSTDAGMTWTEGSVLSDIGLVQQMSFVSPNLGYAIAVTSLGAATILKYTA